jgi:hypothetical protein
MATDLRTAAQQALEALGKFSIGYHVDAVELNDLIATLESALEQPVQEPVAFPPPPKLTHTGVLWAISFTPDGSTEQ